jgi:hypothetical protein
MKPIPDDLYVKLEQVSKTVRDSFRRRGIVIPVKTNNGSIAMGRYRIENKDDGFYAVLNQRDEIVVDKINLPQTAALIANDLELGRLVNDWLVETDKQYGYSLFEETLYAMRIKKSARDLASFEIALTKGTFFKKRREYYQNSIVQRFEKLRKLV